MNQSDRSTIPYSEVEQLRQARSILQAEAEAVSALAQQLDGSFCEAVGLLLNRSGAVIVTGIGKAGLIGQKIVATLSSTGTRAHFLHPTEAIHGDLGAVHPDDIVLAISNSGETEELIRLLPVFEKMQVPVIAMTSSTENSLGKNSTVVLCTGRVQEAGEHGLAPSTSTTAMLALGDALALVTSRMRGFGPKDFARLHPGGSLGRKLQTVKDVMRPLSQLRVANQSSTIRTVLANVRSNARRSGAIVLTDDAGQLTGLFTDSDLVRLLEQRNDDFLDRPIAESMTRSPLTTTGDVFITEAVDVLSRRKFSELPVIDEEGRPIGLVDITDVIGLSPSAPENLSSSESDRLSVHTPARQGQVTAKPPERESA